MAVIDFSQIEVADLTEDVPFEDNDGPSHSYGPSESAVPMEQQPRSVASPTTTLMLSPTKRRGSNTPMPPQRPPKKVRRAPESEYDGDSSVDMAGRQIDVPDNDHFSNLHGKTPAIEDFLKFQERLAREAANMPLPKDLLAEIIDGVPLDDDAPVGSTRRRRGRLVKKGDLDRESGRGDDGNNIDNMFQDEETDLEAEIERDRERIKNAAKGLGLKQKAVTELRTEEILTVDERGEAAINPDAVKDDSGSPKAPGQTPVDSRCDPPQPGDHQIDAEDNMEWIHGNELGAVDKERRFREVKEVKYRWRVPGMHTPLMDHQVLGVEWMIKREMSDVPPRGGLVADAMGLGKTIQAIATMCLNLPPRNDGNNSSLEPRVTLVVAPVALLDQWKEEIMMHCKNGMFSVRIHHGNDRIKTVEELRQEDVVICTYYAVMSSWPRPPKNRNKMSDEEYAAWWQEARKTRGIFHRVKFWRVILDEAHVIKNRKGQISLACQNLDAVHAWALTGTPIQNSLEDIYPVFKFVRHPTGGYWDFFNELIRGGIDPVQKAKRVQALLRGNMMRRTKKESLMGKPLIELPKKRIRMVKLELNAEERAMYNAVESHAITQINRSVRRGQVMNYSAILTLLLRLRQVCNHPYLITQTIGKDFSADDLDRALQLRPKAVEGEEGDGKEKQTKDQKPPSQLRRILLAARKQIPVNIEHCSICEGPMDEPVVARKCRHTFCHSCIMEVIEGDNRHCPHQGSDGGRCGQRVTEDDLRKVEGSDVVNDDDDEEEDWLDKLELGFHHSTKTRALQEQIAAWSVSHPSDKIVLFSQFTKMLDILQRFLNDEGIGYCRYQGGMTMLQRQESLRRFREDPAKQVMLMSIKAGGVGLNLTHANLVICIDMWWNAAVELQAFDRVHRLGQKKEVFITRFVTENTVEERILTLQQKKRTLAKAALGEGGMALGKLTREELLGLFGKMEVRNGQYTLKAYEDPNSSAATPAGPAAPTDPAGLSGSADSSASPDLTGSDTPEFFPYMHDYPDIEIQSDSDLDETEDESYLVSSRPQ